MKFPIPSPKADQTRTIRRFALLPVEVTDDKGNRFRVWFESYNVEQIFVEGQNFITQEWVDVKKVVRNKKGASKPL